MEIFMIILMSAIALLLGILNLKQLAEIQDLNDEINQRKAENQSLMDSIRRLCEGEKRDIE